MVETLILAAAVPSAIGAAKLATRRRSSPAHADNRGIALQTVIIIVVMLVIAGGVAGVLITRGAEVTGDLEAQSVTSAIDNPQKCNNAAVALTGNDGTDSFSASGTTITCTITASVQSEDFTDAACERFTGASGNNAARTLDGTTNRSICTIT